MGGDCPSGARSWVCKKKDLASSKPDKASPEKSRAEFYKSSFDLASKDVPSQFVPPESFGSYSSPDDLDESLLELSSASSWDIATRYHEFKAKKSFQGMAKHLRQLSASAILERAQQILGSVVHPIEQKSSPLSELPFQAEQAEFDLDETLENSPLGILSAHASTDFEKAQGSGALDYILTDHDIWMSYHVHRHQSLILSVDTSLSMTGEKLALTAVALSVVLLEFPDDPIGIIAFENEAKVLKSPDERISVQMLVERFLDVPAQGYTHLEDGMKVALKLVRNTQSSGKGRPPSTVLLTDGKYTAGKDPAYLAPRFPHLVVLKMGRERASHELCLELAKKGRGVLREVGELEALPTVMYGVVKDLLRGRSIV